LASQRKVERRAERKRIGARVERQAMQSLGRDEARRAHDLGAVAQVSAVE
jgi:hypothetical protein